MNTSSLLAVDRKCSVLSSHEFLTVDTVRYTPYGGRAIHLESPGLLAFNGECLDRMTSGYLLGNGYRLYNPHAMRFASPDFLSPFGKGGLNAYAYCEGDPTNNIDPSGRFLLHIFKAITSSIAGGVGLMNAVFSENNYSRIYGFISTLAAVGAASSKVNPVTTNALQVISVASAVMSVANNRPRFPVLRNDPAAIRARR